MPGKNNKNNNNNKAITLGKLKKNIEETEVLLWVDFTVGVMGAAESFRPTCIFNSFHRLNYLYLYIYIYIFYKTSPMSVNASL